jgi:hypothetical protein
MTGNGFTLRISPAQGHPMAPWLPCQLLSRFRTALDQSAGRSDVDGEHSFVLTPPDSGGTRPFRDKQVF